MSIIYIIYRKVIGLPAILGMSAFVTVFGMTPGTVAHVAEFDWCVNSWAGRLRDLILFANVRRMTMRKNI